MADRNEDLRARLLATFKVEVEEHLQLITANLVALQHGPASPGEAGELVETTFREVHTLKGAARSVSRTDVEAVCQAAESLLSRITRGDLDLTPALIDQLHDAMDEVSHLLSAGAQPGAAVPQVTFAEVAEVLEAQGWAPPERLREPQATAGPAPGGAVPAPGARGVAGPQLQTPDTIRVDTFKLDGLLLQAEDLLAPKLAAEERVSEARTLAEPAARLRTALARARESLPRPVATAPAGAPLEEVESGVRSWEAGLSQLQEHLAGDARTTARIVDGLQEELRRLRMVPASSVLDVFPRMVRDIAREQGKEVEWVERGATLEMDRQVLEAMKDPLIHLVRNAISHGVEPPDARALRGKPPRGRVEVTIAALEGNQVEITVRDDGAGLDIAAVQAAAVRARLLSTAEAQGLTEEASIDLVYRSGLSTSPIITEIAGHGLGLAIVKERVERLGGQLRIETQAGDGTTMRMVIPASIASFRGLLVRAGRQLFLLPVDSVQRAVRVDPEAIEQLEAGYAVRLNGHALPVSRLASLLGLPDPPNVPSFETPVPCVVLSSGEEQIGLLVEEVLGEREVLAKELKPPLTRVPNVAGAGVLGSGQMVLILRPADLARSFRARPAGAPAPQLQRQREQALAILVVDDSITTRTMEKNLLETAGYRVRVAVDGLEAWTLLKSEAFDLVVSDVDMPRLDGFGLTARIRGDQQLSELPVILVTALETREDKERGIEAGANAYVVKSSFDQSNLLAIIRRLA